MLTKVNIDLWVLIAGVALPSACLLMISLVYCWRRLFRRRDGSGPGADHGGFNQQVLLEMVLQQTDNAFNSIADAVQEQRTQLLKVLETHQLPLPLAAAETGALGEKVEPASAPRQSNTETPGGSAPPETGTLQQAPSTAGYHLPPKSEGVFDPYRQIPELLHQGLSVSAVATRLNLPESAVELFKSLRMSDSDGKNGRQETA